MQDFGLDETGAQEADRLLRRCVHCGMCNATCPTYQEFGDELDGPRGRIYQIKTMLEGQAPTDSIRQHLDRCLTCLNCTTTCPSGVEYNRLIDIGREMVDKKLKRPLAQRVLRATLGALLPRRRVFAAALAVGQALSPLAPATLRAKIPAKPRRLDATPSANCARRMVLTTGCVQSSLTPNTDAAAAVVLSRLNIQAVRSAGEGCCGAVNHHLQQEAQARTLMRRNIDGWLRDIESGCEAIVVTASGCGVMLKDYAYHLRNDSDYADKAKRVSERVRDLSEIVTPDDVMRHFSAGAQPVRVAFHPPCTLQHGQRLAGRVEALLTAAGYELLPVRDAHLCCGAAGTYSLLQRDTAMRLRDKKLDALTTDTPDVIATANVGCQTHLQGATPVPVRHWLELLAERVES